MKFDEVKKVGVQNLTFNTAKPKETKTTAEIDEKKKFEEFSSGYSACQRALGLSNVSFKGKPKNKPENIQERIAQFKKTLENLKTLDKEFAEIVIENINEDNIESKEEIYNYIKKIKNFPEDEIHFIVHATNNTNIEFAKKLCSEIDIEEYYISGILTHTNEINLELAEELCQDENFPKRELGEILERTNKENIKLAKELCQDEDFPKECVGIILGRNNSEDVPFMKELYRNKDLEESDFVLVFSEYGRNRDRDAEKEVYNLIKRDCNFSGETIINILCAINKENSGFAKELCEDEDFPKECIAEILRCVNEENIELAKELFEDEDFPKECIGTIIKKEEKDYIPFVKKICRNKNFSKKEIGEIINRIKKENIELAKKLCEDEDFPKKCIADILYYVDEENIELAKELCEDEDFPKECIAEILRCVNEENIELAKELCQDKDFPKEYVTNILGVKDKENSQFFIKLYKDKDIDDYFVKLLARSEVSTINAIKEVYQDKDFPKQCINHVADYDTDRIVIKILDSMKDMLAFLKEIKDFPKEYIAGIISEVEPRNIEFGKELCQEKDFPKEQIREILFGCHNNNIKEKKEIYSLLKEIKDFPKECVVGILHFVDEENIELAKELCQDEDFPKKCIADILRCANKKNIELVKELCQDEDFPKECIGDILYYVNEENIELAKELLLFEDFSIEKIEYIIENTRRARFENYEYFSDLILNGKQNGHNLNDIYTLISNPNILQENELKNLKKTASKEVYEEIMNSPMEERILAIKLAGLCKKNNINEIPIYEKRKLIKNIMYLNIGLFKKNEIIEKYFPLAPKNQKEYCELLSSLVKSSGIESNELNPDAIQEFNSSLSNIANTLAELKDEEFDSLEITQEYSKENFIKDVLKKVENLSPAEKQKVYDYFGFELRENKKSNVGFSILGYPVNLNNGKKLAQIEDENTKKVVEDLRNNVIKFSTNNKIQTENAEITKYLNELASAMPEIHTMIGKQQEPVHAYDIMKHSLKVVQKISQNKEFKSLNESDKKLVLLAGLMHDICKRENREDKCHPTESAFDSYYIAKKLNLTKEEEIKLYTLIKHHDWYEHINSNSKKEKTKNLQSIAFDFQYGNLFKLAKIFAEADLKSIKSTDKFYELHSGNLSEVCEKINKNIKELQKTSPMLPTTKIPRASTINNRIKSVNSDGSTNIKGVYKDKNGLIIIKYNEIENWQNLGFAEGCASKGIEIPRRDGSVINTGNIKFIAHGLDYANQLSNFDAFALPDSDALLSVSYMERPESKYRLFRTQGVLLDVDTKYIHGGGRTDAGSGCGKNIDSFKSRYIFGGERQSDRNFISDLIKETLNLDNEGYSKFLKENSNKRMDEIEPKETREKLIKAFAIISSRRRQGGREYNEMYVSNPKIAGVFGYSETDEVGDIMEFVENKPEFLKKYAVENDIPFIIFGD